MEGPTTICINVGKLLLDAIDTHCPKPYDTVMLFCWTDIASHIGDALCNGGFNGSVYGPEGDVLFTPSTLGSIEDMCYGTMLASISSEQLDLITEDYYLEAVEYVQKVDYFKCNNTITLAELPDNTTLIYKRR
jgi:hypothetical protein